MSTTMKRVDLEAFLELPVGRFHASLPLVLWAWSPSLVGIAHVGAITSADLPLLRRGAELPFHRALARPYRAVIDASRLTHLDPDVFAFLVEHLQAVRLEGAALVRTLCIVRPPGLHGAAALGLVHQYMDAIETCFVDTLDDALAAVASPSELAEMDELRQMFAAQSLLDRVRDALVESPNLPITTVATRLGASVRTLQRALAVGGTTYRNEAARSRLLHARHLLATSDDGLDAIARSAGYGSAITLSRAIREVYGTGPRSGARRRTR